jgi:phosphotransferase system enzyme I (PtsI)
MLKFQGKSVYQGIAIGKLSLYQKSNQIIKRKRIDNIEAEISRYEEASQAAISQLASLYEKALEEVGAENAAIFEIHQMMLQDADYIEGITTMIRTEQINAEYAVASTADRFAEVFSSMDDAYMKERAADVKDISERLVNCLSGNVSAGAVTQEPSIIVADDLAPSETVQMDKTKVLAFVTVHGSTNSHTAILARTMNIPALIGTELTLTESLNGVFAVVDGFTGTLILDPDQETLEKYQKQQAKELEKRALLQELKGKETKTIDGTEIKLYANIGDTSDLDSVLQNDAGGIGLFRSEFIYLGRDTFPTEEEQFKIYKTVAKAMGDKNVIIRTLDIGADKQVGYFNLDKEENPALGYRAIRICLRQPEIFKTQLRAILRASVFGNLSIMYPMIISLDELWAIKEIVKEVKLSLDAQGIAYQNVKEGIMIETPAAVMISDLLAKEVDFFSIGTNDLTQYTLAIDRQNPKLDYFYNAHHEAVLRMIKMVVDNAHKEGIWAGICGELGADMALTETFLKMGVDELSVSPSFILPVRKKVRETTL